MAPNLDRGPIFITANGQQNNSIGKIQRMLDMCLCKGSPAETNFMVHTVVVDTYAYDIILGSDFFGACLGAVDYFKEKFIWRTDGADEDVSLNKAYLPIKCCGTIDERRAQCVVKVITCADDLFDAKLGN